MSDKKRFWVLLFLLALSIAWLYIAHHYGTDSLLRQFQ